MLPVSALSSDSQGCKLVLKSAPAEVSTTAPVGLMAELSLGAHRAHPKLSLAQDPLHGHFCPSLSLLTLVSGGGPGDMDKRFIIHKAFLVKKKKKS